MFSSLGDWLGLLFGRVEREAESSPPSTQIDSRKRPSTAAFQVPITIRTRPSPAVPPSAEVNDERPTSPKRQKLDAQTSNGAPEISLTKAELKPSAPRAPIVISAESSPPPTSGFPLTYPSPDAHDALTITLADFYLLLPGELLNDTIIDFYLRYLVDHCPPRLRSEIFLFNSFFYTKLARHRNSSPTLHRWVKSVDLFAQRFLIVPIHMKTHWSIAVVCNAGRLVNRESTLADDDCPCILLLDSLQLHDSLLIFAKIRMFLTEEYSFKKGGAFKFTELNLPGRCPEVPRQTNEYDCGVFALHYLELFLAREHPVADLITVPGTPIAFPLSAIQQKREHIADLLQRLAATGAEESPIVLS